MAKPSKKKKIPPEVAQIKETAANEILPGKPSPLPWPTLLQALVIAAAVFWIYWPALHGDWLWDDGLLVTNNPVVRDPYGLWKIWFDPGTLVDYQPLKVSVSWLQWHLWGANTLGYHLTNVLLHLLGALLVWRLLSKFGLRLAWLGGLVFAIHPVQVESVAWIAELKNTLSLPPFLLAMCAWIDFEERGKKRDYFLALGLFLAAMLCKTTMVMFPVVILLYAWWKRGRIGARDLRASSPFFIVSLTLGLATVWFLRHSTRVADLVPMGGFSSRLACAGLALSFYFSKSFLPVELLPIYPRWVIDPPTLLQFLPWPILLGVIFWLGTRPGNWSRHALLGLGFFLLLLAPFLGFNAGSYMAFTWVMDHALYLPMIGLIGLVVAALTPLENHLPSSFRPCGIGLVAVMLALLAFGSRSYAKVFINEETLWTYELRHNPEAWLAHNNLGYALRQEGRQAEAIGEIEEALRLNPDYFDALINLGDTRMQMGRAAQARESYAHALQLMPASADAHYGLGRALFQIGQVSNATEQYEQALTINPNNPDAHNNLGVILLQSGRLAEALGQFELALQIKPDFAEARFNLGIALQQSSRYPEAIEQFEQGLRIKPGNAEVHENLGYALLQTGRLTEATGQFEQALTIRPDDASMHNNLGNALLQSSQLPEAIAQYRQALRLNPDFAEVHNNLGYALQQTGRLPEAREQYQEALRIKPDFTAARNNLARLQALQKPSPPKN